VLRQPKNPGFFFALATCFAIYIAHASESHEPSGPRHPSPHSRPPCADAAPVRDPLEMVRRAMARIQKALVKASAEPQTLSPPLPPAIEAQPIHHDALLKHRCFLQVAQQGNIDLLFIGDSITDHFGRSDRGQAVWNAYYGKLKAANFGISGNTTQDVLWRIMHGELEGLKTKVIVLMLGTNNIGRNANSDIAAGNAAIVNELRRRQPQAKILLLGIFPRDHNHAPVRETIKQINRSLAKLADDQFVFYLDIGPHFLDSDGSFKDDVMADRVHPTTKGYEIWAQAIDPNLKQLLH
jgi:lysophospholipase L1-like esterase